jgi:hypothetical protein
MRGRSAGVDHFKVCNSWELSAPILEEGEYHIAILSQAQITDMLYRRKFLRLLFLMRFGDAGA